jgi:uncharacterized paraquat-inducible protein A
MNYSEITTCPLCNSKVALEDVRFTAYFQCPHCKADISVSTGYRRSQVAVGILLALAVSIVTSLRLNIFAGLLVFFPCEIVVIFLLAYIGKYFMPPRLVTIGSACPRGTLGL